MAEQSLLKKALSQKGAMKGKRVEVSNETEEAALAWCRGDVTLTQLARAVGIGNSGHQMYALLAHSLKSYINKSSKPKK
jgi:hypothetical protein